MEDDVLQLLSPKGPDVFVIEIDRSSRWHWTADWTAALSLPADTLDRAVDRLARLRQVRPSTGHSSALANYPAA